MFPDKNHQRPKRPRIKRAADPHQPPGNLYLDGKDELTQKNTSAEAWEKLGGKAAEEGFNDPDLLF